MHAETAKEVAVQSEELPLGREVAPDVELSALSLFGIGSGTEIDHVQVKNGLDDGFEIFGGHCDLKYALATGIGDDSFDYSFGWQGRGQFWVAQQRGNHADNGFEADNSEDEFAARPLTRPVLCNVTLIGDPSSDPSLSGSDIGLLLRRGGGGLLYNAIVMGFKDAGLDIDNGLTTQNIDSGDLLVDHSVFYLNGPDGAADFMIGERDSEAETPENGFEYTTRQFAAEVMTSNIEAMEPPVVDGFNLDDPDFTPQQDALTDPFDPRELNSDIEDPDFFEAAPFRGAVPPGTEQWTRAAWISYLGQ